MVNNNNNAPVSQRSFFISCFVIGIFVLLPIYNTIWCDLKKQDFATPLPRFINKITPLVNHMDFFEY